MNFGLRTDSRGIELQAQYGRNYDHGSTVLDSGKSRQLAGNLGLGLGDTFFLNLSGEYHDDEGTSRGETRPIAVIFAQNNPALANRLPNYPLPVQLWGSSPAHGWKAALNSGVNVGPNTQIYLTLLGAYNHANESFNYRSPISGVALDVNGDSHSLGANEAFTTPFYQTLCPAGNLTCAPGGYVQDANTFFFSSIYPAGFTPRFIGITKEKFGTLGWKGEHSRRPDVGPVRHPRQKHADPVDEKLGERVVRRRVANELPVRHAQSEGNERQPRHDLPGQCGPVQPDHPGVGRGVSEGDLRIDRRRPAIIWRRALRNLTPAVYPDRAEHLCFGRNQHELRGRRCGLHCGQEPRREWLWRYEPNLRR